MSSSWNDSWTPVSGSARAQGRKDEEVTQAIQDMSTLFFTVNENRVLSGLLWRRHVSFHSKTVNVLCSSCFWSHLGSSLHYYGGGGGLLSAPPHQLDTSDCVILQSFPVSSNLLTSFNLSNGLSFSLLWAILPLSCSQLHPFCISFRFLITFRSLSLVSLYF